jgi:Tfp pilus assembly protein PilN
MGLPRRAHGDRGNSLHHLACGVPFEMNRRQFLATASAAAIAPVVPLPEVVHVGIDYGAAHSYNFFAVYEGVHLDHIAAVMNIPRRFLQGPTQEQVESDQQLRDRLIMERNK